MAREHADDLAVFCLITGVQPSEYPGLTLLERDRFMAWAQQIYPKRRR